MSASSTTRTSTTTQVRATTAGLVAERVRWAAGSRLVLDGVDVAALAGAGDVVLADEQRPRSADSLG